MDKGAFQTSRSIFESDIWNDVTKFRLFFYIYGNAVFAKEGTTVAGMKLERGQYLRSYRNLRDDLEFVENRSIKKYSLSVIKRKVDQLIKENRLKIEDTELGTLFTVVNYESYQGLDNYKNGNLERRKNADGTGMERSENNNKNGNKDKNDKNVKDYTSKIKDLLPVFSSITNFNELNKKYWDLIRETRKNGNVAKSVIYNNMYKWKKYDPVVIEYALKSHIDMHAGKKEEYTLGIMRNTKKEEAVDRMNRISGFKGNVVQMPKYEVTKDESRNGTDSKSSGNVRLFR